MASVSLAVVVGVTSIGWTAAQLKTWNDGDVLKAADLNSNFAALSSQIAALTAPLTWNKLTFMGGWTAYGNGYADPSYARDALGIVHLQGSVKGTPSPGMLVAQLPAGFRPAAIVEEAMACGGTSPCTVAFKPTGDVVFEMIYPASSWVSFDGLTFSAAP
ncbi:MAG TPA: hypothetical protein VHL80_18310 [Polyangia bacterium]|nr:hypothetical protein [Polyangia bacterium]